MSDGDDGLSGEDLHDIIDLFRKDYAAVQTYMVLLNHNNLRKGWLEKQLKELKDWISGHVLLFVPSLVSCCCSRSMLYVVG